MENESAATSQDYKILATQIISAYLNIKPEEFPQYLIDIGIAAEVPREILDRLKAKE